MEIATKLVWVVYPPPSERAMTLWVHEYQFMGKSMFAMTILTRNVSLSDEAILNISIVLDLRFSMDQ